MTNISEEEVSLYNTLTGLKPSQRVEYLQSNNYIPTDILRKYREYKNDIRANSVIDCEWATEPLINEVIPSNAYLTPCDDLRTGISVVPRDSPRSRAVLTEPTPASSVVNNKYEYILTLNDNCYNIVINSYVCIEIDTITKTIKIIDDVEGINKEIFNINI
jgi:hypothetical protein